MSIDPQRPVLAAKREEKREEKRAPSEPTARLQKTQRQMPQSPVIPQFSDPPPGARARARRGCLGGYVFAVLAISVIVLSLVVLGLFLPPFSLWEEIENRLDDNADSGGDMPAGVQMVGGLAFLPLNATAPEVVFEGLTISADPLQEPFSVYVTSLAPTDYLAGNVPAAGWFCETALPSGHALASPVYSLAQIGTPPAALTVRVTALPETTADPAALELLELNVWNATKGAWEFVAGGAETNGTLTADLTYLPRCVAIFRESESERRAGVTLGLIDQFAPEVMSANVQLYPGSLRPTQTGALQVVLAPGFQTGQGYDVLPLLQNFDDPAVIDAVTVQRILENAALRTEHARQIAAFVLSDPGYVGVAVDYRAIPPDQRDAYTAFLRDLADLLSSQDRTLTVVLPTPAHNGDTWDTGAYDWPAIGRIADEVVITAPLDPMAYVPDGPVDTLMAWAVTQISRSNLVLGLSAASVEDSSGGLFAPVVWPDALSYLGELALEPSEDGETITAWLAGVPAEFGTDESAQTPYVRYLDSEGQSLRTMWITTPDALYFRMSRAAAYNLGGVYVRDLMSPGGVPGLSTALLAYRLDQPLEPGPALALEWAARDGEDDTVLAQGTDQPFTFEVGNFSGMLTIEAQVYGQVIASETITIAAPEPTVAPTDESTETPAVTPTNTPEPTNAPTDAPTETPLPTATELPISTEAPLPTATTAAEVAELTTVPLPLPTTAELTTEPLPQPTMVSELPSPTASAEAGPELTAVGVQPTPQPGITIQAQPTSIAVLPSPTAEPLPTSPVLNVTPVDLSQPLPVVDPALLATANIGTKFEVGAQMGGVSSAILYAGRMHTKWIKIDVHYLLGQNPADQQPIIDDVQANGFKILLNVYGDPFEFMGTDRATYLAAYADFVGQLTTNGADGIEVWREMNGRMTAAEYTQLLAYAYHAIKTADPTTLVITGALRPVAASEDPEELDGTFYQRLAEAGVTQFADCIGTQYVLGTVPPAATSGDARGDNAIYYLSRASDGPRLAAGGVRPICYTRLGYLSPEGYPPLPEDYAWAQNTTAAQQAQWLADAIRLALEGGQVRLVIIWSLEAAYFGGGSFEAGYAVIRPSDTCPACDLIEPMLKEPGQ